MKAAELLEIKKNIMSKAAISLVSVYDEAAWVDHEKANDILDQMVQFIKDRKNNFNNRY